MESETVIVPALELYPLLNKTRTSRGLKKLVPAGTNNAFTVYSCKKEIFLELNNEQWKKVEKTKIQSCSDEDIK